MLSPSDLDAGRALAVNAEGPVDSSPAVVDGTIYDRGGGGTGSREAYALDAATGQLRWAYIT